MTHRPNRNHLFTPLGTALAASIMVFLALPSSALAQSPNAFGRPTDAHLSAGIGLGHTYLLRLTHRTRIGDERLYVLRVLDYTPGVKVTFMWRQIEMLITVAPFDGR